MYRLLLSCAISCIVCSSALADTFDCRVEQKYNSIGAYPVGNLVEFQPRVLLDVTKDGTYLSRCSISLVAGGVETCETYTVDRIVVDKRVGISKYYYFEGQFDMQVWPSGQFIENNGRGSVSFGSCTISRNALP